jgi:hypothetical protein
MALPAIFEANDLKRFRQWAIDEFRIQWARQQKSEAECENCAEARELNKTVLTPPICALHFRMRHAMMD